MCLDPGADFVHGKILHGALEGIISIMCAASEDPSRDDLLSESHHSLSWPPHSVPEWA